MCLLLLLWLKLSALVALAETFPNFFLSPRHSAYSSSVFKGSMHIFLRFISVNQKIKNSTITTVNAKTIQIRLFLIQYFQTNFLVDWSNILDSSLIRRALSSVACKLYCLSPSIPRFYRIISWMLSSSFFIRSTFFIEVGSSNSFFFDFIIRSNFTK